MRNNTGGRNSRDYRESELRIVLKERGTWRRWNDVARWLHSEGRRDRDLKPSVAQLMLDDIDNLVMDGVPFTDDPGEAFKLAHAHRHRPHRGHHRRDYAHRLHPRYPRT